MTEMKAPPRNKLVLEKEVLRQLRVRSDIHTGRNSKSYSLVGCGVTRYCTTTVVADV